MCWILSKAFSASVKVNHMVFILQFVNVVYRTDGFVDGEDPLHPWDKSHLLMMYNPLNVLLDVLC